MLGLAINLGDLQMCGIWDFRSRGVIMINLTITIIITIIITIVIIMIITCGRCDKAVVVLPHVPSGGDEIGNDMHSPCRLLLLDLTPKL